MTKIDDAWSVSHLYKMAKADRVQVSSYRYADPEGLVHRAVSFAGPYHAMCGARVVEKLQENDPGAITCVRCLWAGA